MAIASAHPTARNSAGESVSPPPPSSGKRYYRAELDSLRFFAFLGVFIFHIAPRDPQLYLAHHFHPAFLIPWVCGVAGAGAFGVDLFFALSAYLITVLLLRERSARGHIDVKAFYVRRILRIWPVYFFFVAIAALIPHWVRSQKLPWPYVAGYLLLAGNWVYAFKGIPTSMAVPLWSISVEEQFYVCWPLLLRKMTTRKLLWGVCGLLLAGNLVRIILISMHASGAAVEYNTFARIDAIGLGILAACVLGDRTPKLSLAARGGLSITALLTWITIAMYGGLNSPRTAAPVLGTLIGRPLVAVAATTILVSFIGAVDQLKALGSPTLTYLGRISYGLYVYHLAGLLIARSLLPGEDLGESALHAVIALAITIVVSAISYRWLESPFLRLKERFAVVKSRPV
jgi:peptidoglycan/LPS O-acetylase OafA/YrhL